MFRRSHAAGICTGRVGNGRRSRGRPAAGVLHVLAILGALTIAATWSRGLSASPQAGHPRVSVLSGQSSTSTRLFARRDGGAGVTGPQSGSLPVSALDRGQGLTARPGQGGAFLSSLIVPGLGQYRLGTRRWIAYAGLEALAIFLYLDSRMDARDLRVAYRDFAWEAARSGLSTEPRLDGDFHYYEVLSKWRASGSWDANPAREGVQPEADPSTFNGSVWALAAQIFSVAPGAAEGSPRYERALQYYRDQGYGPPFLWAWSEESGDRQHFGGLITSSDERFKDARRALGIMLANHMLSAVDGLVTARLGVLHNTGTVGVSVTMSTPDPPW